MYTTLRFKNGIYADILNDEVIAWCYEIDGTQQSVCHKKYKGDDELIIVLEEIRKRVNSDQHREVWDFLLEEFNGDGDSITYAKNGSLIVKANGSYSPPEFNCMLERLEEVDGVSVGEGNAWNSLMSLTVYRPVYHLGKEVAKIFY